MRVGSRIARSTHEDVLPELEQLLVLGVQEEGGINLVTLGAQGIHVWM